MPFSSPLQDYAAKLRASLATKKFTAKPVKSIKALTLQDIKSLNRPAPSWRWHLVLPPAPNAKAEQIAPKKSFFSTLFGKAPQSSIIVCESIEIPPTIGLGRQDRYYKGHNVAFPSLPGYDTVSAIFYESEDYATFNYFKEWQKFVYNPDTKVYGVPATYGRTVEFLALPLTDYEDVKKYTSLELRTCWPLTIQKLSYGNSTDRIKIQVEFAFHELKTTIVGGPSSAGNDAGSVVNKVGKWLS